MVSLGKRLAWGWDDWFGYEKLKIMKNKKKIEISESPSEKLNCYEIMYHRNDLIEMNGRMVEYHHYYFYYFEEICEIWKSWRNSLIAIDWFYGFCIWYDEQIKGIWNSKQIERASRYFDNDLNSQVRSFFGSQFLCVLLDVINLVILWSLIIVSFSFLFLSFELRIQRKKQAGQFYLSK